LHKSQVRAEAERLGLRTWDKPDSQDVCFIEASAGREAFLRDRIPLTVADIVDDASGAVIGVTQSAELMTLGQRKGVLPDRHGEKRFVSKVDLGARRVHVGRLEDILVTSLTLDLASLTFAREPLESGTDVLVQVSAHGTPMPARLVYDTAWRVTFAEPVRPVAAGQSAVFYDVNEPDAVVGAALVARADA
jgi:tRNA-specific 2-thiouridylase